MVKYTQKFRQQQLKNCSSVFDRFLRLALKGLIEFIGDQSNAEEIA